MRIKPQFEVGGDVYEPFRSRSGDLPTSWVIEEMLIALIKPGASDMVSLRRQSREPESAKNPVSDGCPDDPKAAGISITLTRFPVEKNPHDPGLSDSRPTLRQFLDRVGANVSSAKANSTFST